MASERVQIVFKVEPYTLNLRMPSVMADRLKEQARANGRSLNAEIVQRLRKSLDGYKT